MFGRRHPLLNLAHDEYGLKHGLDIPTSFDSVIHAKSCLDILASGVLRLRGDLMTIAEDAALSSGEAPSDPSRRQCYIQALSRSVNLGSDDKQILSRQRALEAGIASFWRAMEAFGEPSEDSGDRAIMAIQIQYLLVFFTAVTCRKTYERVCDGFNYLFKTTMDLAQRYIQLAPRFADSSRIRNLTFEPGIIPTIYLAVNKCRNPAIRNHAIALLQDGCMQEAIWDGKPFATFMQRLANLEEAQMVQHLDTICEIPDETSNAEAQVLDIPEHARYTDVVIADELDEQGQGRLVCARYRHETGGTIEISEHAVSLTAGEKLLFRSD